MKTSSRFLLGFGIIILAIVAVAVILAVTGGNQQVKLLPETSPEGTVQRFLMAVKDHDFQKAYSLLAPQPEQVKGDTYENWVRSVQSPRDTSSWKASILKSTVRDNDATVEVAVDIIRPEGPLINPVTTNQVVFMLQKQDGKWLISQPADIWWLY
jgi:uncharacterized membrane protein YvbJ